MPAIPLVNEFLEAHWRASGRRHFRYHHYLAAYNDVAAWIGQPASLITNGLDCGVTITDIDITHVNAVPGAVLDPIIVFLGDGTIGDAAYLPSHTTTALTDLHYINGVDLVMDQPKMVAGGYWLLIYIAGSAPLDGIAIDMRGYIESTPTAGSLQAVSVEGYKWPLSRR